MSLNNIQLHPQLLAGLYSNVLVEQDVVQPSDSNPSPAREWNALVGNKKNILVVVAHEGNMHLPDTELQFLISVLKACQLTLADVAIINVAALSEKNYKPITADFESRIILLFQVGPLEFGLPV